MKSYMKGYIKYIFNGNEIVLNTEKNILNRNQMLWFDVLVPMQYTTKTEVKKMIDYIQGNYEVVEDTIN